MQTKMIKILQASVETYLEPCKTCTMECFAKMANGLKAVISKRSIVDVWQNFKCAFDPLFYPEISNCFC